MAFGTDIADFVFWHSWFYLCTLTDGCAVEVVACFHHRSIAKAGICEFTVWRHVAVTDTLTRPSPARLSARCPVLPWLPFSRHWNDNHFLWFSFWFSVHGDAKIVYDPAWISKEENWDRIFLQWLLEVNNIRINTHWDKGFRCMLLDLLGSPHNPCLRTWEARRSESDSWCHRRRLCCTRSTLSTRTRIRQLHQKENSENQSGISLRNLPRPLLLAVTMW